MALYWRVKVGNQELITTQNLAKPPFNIINLDNENKQLEDLSLYRITISREPVLPPRPFICKVCPCCKRQVIPHPATYASDKYASDTYDINILNNSEMIIQFIKQMDDKCLGKGSICNISLKLWQATLASIEKQKIVRTVY